jgi:hypothetical protein
MARVIIGLILLIFGFFLCLSIVGAVIGIPMMIVGVIVMALGGRRVVVKNIVTVSNVTHSPAQSAPIGWEAQSAAPARATPNTSPTHAPRIVGPTTSYDRKRWETLLKYDGDLRSAAEKIRPYGTIYEDELAEAYLNINDKGYLETITNNILKTARESPQLNSDVAVDVPTPKQEDRGIVTDFSRIAQWTIANGEVLTIGSMDTVRKAATLGCIVEYYPGQNVILTVDGKQYLCKTNRDLMNIATTTLSES